MSQFFEQKLTAIPGLRPQWADLLLAELEIGTIGELIQYYPFRYIDKTRILKLQDLYAMHPDEVSEVQVRGRLNRIAEAGSEKARRLTALLTDESGTAVELTWFRSIDTLKRNLRPGMDYIAFGKPESFNGRYSFVHPDMEVVNPSAKPPSYLMPVYNTSEKMKKRWLDSKALVKLMQTLLKMAHQHIAETLPEDLCTRLNLVPKRRAMIAIHFPANEILLEQARARLKFEELFFLQLKILREKEGQHTASAGFIFGKLSLLTDFYKHHLPFSLTGAQKRVIREIHTDCSSGKQMNRLLQGDVGSGKTIVAFISMLMAIDNGRQACLMAPTEILAGQHFNGLQKLAAPMGLSIAKLTGSTKKKDRDVLHKNLQSGDLNILIGTHALLEDKVQFQSLGLCVIDEQHRFGVEQRSKLWKKNPDIPPHVLVMTATPIPRTLAMTLYGDLDLSVIDELPPGRKSIRTVHRRDSDRLSLFGFMRGEIAKGRQVYVVYPLIEESEAMDYKDLMDGYESIVREFPMPDYLVSIVHGRMKPADKDIEMDRFVKGVTHIMVATTVIEVGVDVPNASVMVIESAEKFGLSQLHQLRGRVGRGAEQSYCILMTGDKLGNDSRTRISTMCATNDGFEIADVDLKLRGPGDLSGTRQSGITELQIADLSKDGAIVQASHKEALQILAADPYFEQPENAPIRMHIDSLHNRQTNWSRIS
ncbi:MAG: ATP-dependent DNA helicase RecG [Bacteroidota bacterium]